MNARDIKTDNIKLKILVYGKSGSGKTQFIGTFPKPYIFDFDNGMLTLKGKDVNYDTYIDEFRNGVLVQSAITKFNSKLNEVLANPNYETIGIDSVTLMEDAIMKQVVSLNRVGKKQEPTQYEWGLLIAHMQDFFGQITKVNKHVVVVAHEMTIKNELTGEIQILPLISGKKLPGQLPIWFDEVYRMETSKDGMGKMTYQLVTTAGMSYTAKSRLNCLAEREIPDFNVIMGKVKVRG